MHPLVPSARRGSGAVLVLSSVTLIACESLIDVDTPHVLTDEDFGDPASAEFQVESAVALFECGYSAFAWVGLGHEDVMESVAGVASSVHVFRATPARGECDTSASSQAWFDQIMGARAMLSNARGDGVYDRMRNEWSLGAEGARLSAIGAIYMAATLGHLGEFYCEVTLDDGDLLTPDEVLDMAEEWVTERALQHIDAYGDFALPNQIATSARSMAVALRARIRWARGDLQGAASDAEAVPQGFTAWVTREDERTRRNKPYLAETASGFGSMLGVNDWWDPSIRRPNPATGLPWPDPIPFTGYLFLGVLPDGRAVDDAGYPIRWAEEERVNSDPVPLGNGAAPDGRVEHFPRIVAGPDPRESPSRYDSEFDDIPLVSWRELWLIRAEHEGGQAAIDLVDDLRAAAGLPPVTYIDGATATPQQIRYMILEERRRALFSEGGRHWSAKIRNPDVLWFPRAEGRTPRQGYSLRGGVRLSMPDEEYLTNPFLQARGGLDARGTGCEPSEAPVFP